MDVVEARFVDLVPQKCIGLSIKFLSEDAQCARIMMIVWLLGTMSNGTLVAVVADDMPSDALCDPGDIGERSIADCAPNSG
jgi:hypothetical protein